MSLVLNTNENFTVKFSNSQLWELYPQFDQILLKPSFANTKVITAAETFPSSNSAKNVNGTIVNYYSGILISPNCFTQNYWWFWHFQINTASVLWKYRFAVEQPLLWWEIVWRNIFCKFLYWRTNNNTASLDVWIRVWLLHTDGSISYVWDEMLQGFSLPWTANLVLERQYHQENAGLVWQSWDLIIAEISLKAWATITHVDFWRDWWILPWSDSNSNPPYPIQISIE